MFYLYYSAVAVIVTIVTTWQFVLFTCVFMYICYYWIEAAMQLAINTGIYSTLQVANDARFFLFLRE